MIPRIAFRLFLLCLICCATMVLIGIWFGEHVFPEFYFQTTATVFVVGLASFLIWLSATLQKLNRER